ncbi:hypothetical protein FOMPIDRAFT_1024978 [Fomitopsis schrenkii]|uniref:Uncharacterized protein n=1 Tax=Fomitopsis schrenkii TaxID=2126942 RepID=S8F762_FOMSC|nr:hypothetical protein FOMPIDRAFT_1024978 [Fomitopsis schrenkii]
MSTSRTRVTNHCGTIALACGVRLTDTLGHSHNNDTYGVALTASGDSSHRRSIARVLRTPSSNGSSAVGRKL